MKDFGCLMEDPGGRWRLAPAYDVTYAENEAWTRQHQMSVNGKCRGIARSDLLRVGRNYDLPEDGSAVIDEVVDSLDRWREYASAAEVPDRMVERLECRLERFR